MSQVIWSTINPATTSGTQLASILDDFKDAVVSGFSGTSRPTNLNTYGYWVDTTNAGSGSVDFMLYDGSTDITMFTINTSTQAIEFGDIADALTILKTSDDAVGASLDFNKNRILGGGQTLTNDVLGDLEFSGYDSGAVSYVQAKLSTVSTDDVTSGTRGCDFIFYATSNGAGALVEVMRVTDKKLGVGTDSPDNTIHAKALDSSAGIKTTIVEDSTTGTDITINKQRSSGNGQVLSGDTIGSTKFTSTDQNGAEIAVAKVEVLASENHTDAAQGTTLKIANKDNGSTSYTEKIVMNTDAVTIDNGARINFGTAADARRLILPKNTTTNLDGLTDVEASLAYDTSKAKPVYNDGGQWKAIGSGTGGGYNYFDNAGAEDNATTGWTRYKNTSAGAQPDDFGGTPSATTVWDFEVDSTGPGIGTYNFKLNKKTGNNIQGEGVYYEFTSELFHRTNAMTYLMWYLTTTNYVDGDVRVFLVGSDDDFTADFRYIEGSNVEVGAVSAPDRHKTELQFADTTVTKYRLCLHYATTVTTTFEMDLDELSLGPSSLVSGAVMSDWTAYTPTVTNATTSSTEMFYARVGDSVRLKGRINLTGVTGTIGISLPSGLSMDTAKLPTTGNIILGGEATVEDTGTGFHNGSVRYATATTLNFIGDDGLGNLWNATNPITWASGDKLSIDVIVPVQGWSITTQMSDDQSQRSLNIEYTGNGGGAVTANVTDIDFATKAVATHSGWSGTVFTAPFSATYNFIGGVRRSGVAGANVSIYKNGSVHRVVSEATSTDIGIHFGTRLQLDKGDTASFRLNVSDTLINSSTHYLNIEQTGNPSTISATETVAARYTTTAGQNTTSGAITVINFGTKDFDTHNAVTTGGSWVFACPVSGFYAVTGSVLFETTANWAVDNKTYSNIYLNGAAHSAAQVQTIASSDIGSAYMGEQISTLVYCNKGDTIDYRAVQTTGSDLTMSTFAGWSYITIHRVG